MSQWASVAVHITIQMHFPARQHFQKHQTFRLDTVDLFRVQTCGRECVSAPHLDEDMSEGYM